MYRSKWGMMSVSAFGAIGSCVVKKENFDLEVQQAEISHTFSFSSPKFPNPGKKLRWYLDSILFPAKNQINRDRKMRRQTITKVQLYHLWNT